LVGNSETPDRGRLLQVACNRTEAVLPGHCFRLSFPGTGISLTLPVLDSSDAEGWLAFHVPPPAGQETDQETGQQVGLAAMVYGAACDLDGPLGEALKPASGARQLVVLTDAGGLPAVLFAARLGAEGRFGLKLVLAELGAPAMVRLRPSRFMLPGMTPATIAGLAPLEDAGIVSRVADPAGELPGTHDGDMPSMLEAWLDARSAEQRWNDAVAVVGGSAFVARCTPLLGGRVGQYQRLTIPAATA